MAKPHWKHLDVATLDFNDKATWELISSGDTSGVFQIESAGMTEVCKRVKPNCMEDLIAILALYRPDSMGELEHFIKRKHGEEEVTYIHEDMIPILSATYGCLIYQEQVMFIVKKFAGFSDGEADKFRKGIGKKDKEVVKKEAHKFYERCIQQGYDEAIAREIADFLEKMGGYLFNKGHSAGYAITSYKTAYLKANHRMFYMASILSNQKKESGQTNYQKVGFYIMQSKLMGINVTSPDINNSGEWFKAMKIEDKETILYGFNLIKGIGKSVSKLIIENRPYNSFNNFLEKLGNKGSGLNKTAIVALVKAGAFDTISKKTRAELLTEYGTFRFNNGLETDFKPIQKANKNHIAKLVELGIVRGREIEDRDACTIKFNKWRAGKFKEHWQDTVLYGDYFSWEFEAISYHLSKNPFEGIEFKEWEEYEEEETCEIGGVVIKVSKTKVKRGRSIGQEMAFLSVDTQDGLREVTVFSNDWTRFRDRLDKGSLVVIKGLKQGDQVLFSGMKSLKKYKEDSEVLSNYGDY